MLIGLSNGQEIGGVFPTGCILEHSCVPNCFYTFDIENGYKISVKAGKDIEMDEHLKIMYTHILWGTQMRREHLKETKYFDCCCKRCSDPTELGSYISALKCIGTDIATCGGYIIPANPLDNASDWGCDRCPSRIGADQQRYLMSKMSEEVDAITIDRQGTVKEFETLIDKFSQLLHKNHYYIFNLKHSLIQLYGQQSNNMSDSLLEKKILMCEDLMNVVNIIDPTSIRLAFYTSIILFELHSAIIQLYLKKSEFQMDKFIEAKSYAERAKKIIEIEIDSPAGKQLYNRISKGIEDLNEILENKK